MRLTDWEAGKAIKEHLEPLGRTTLNIIYAEKSNPSIVIKATGYWLDGEMYDHAMFAEDTSATFKREAAIYEALSPHPHILTCHGAAFLPPANRDGEMKEAWAVKFERAPFGNLREHIERDEEPPLMARRL